jgi:hypothetical protein
MRIRGTYHQLLLKLFVYQTLDPIVTFLSFELKHFVQLLKTQIRGWLVSETVVAGADHGFLYPPRVSLFPRYAAVQHSSGLAALFSSDAVLVIIGQNRVSVLVLLT